MALRPEHLPHLQRLAKASAFQSPMLMLGLQECVIPGTTTRQVFQGFGVQKYQEWDLDGGDIRLDLNEPQYGPMELYGSVFNLGTLEHVWDAHQAWCNAARAVRTGGWLVSLSPVGGWQHVPERHHGIHLTSAAFILEFVQLNGFEIVDQWIDQPKQGPVLWLAARKMRSMGEFRKPMQVYKNGKK